MFPGCLMNCWTKLGGNFPFPCMAKDNKYFVSFPSQTLCSCVGVFLWWKLRLLNYKQLVVKDFSFFFLESWICEIKSYRKHTELPLLTLALLLITQIPMWKSIWCRMVRDWRRKRRQLKRILWIPTTMSLSALKYHLSKFR